jgi:hypothetical protein
MPELVEIGDTLTEQAPVGPLGRPIRLLAVTRNHRLLGGGVFTVGLGKRANLAAIG